MRVSCWLALVAGLFPTLVLAYQPGEAARPVDATLTTFFAECAAGDDANTNIYDEVADWTQANLNDANATYHCIEAGDYEGHANFDITVSDRVIGFYDPDLTGSAVTCGTPGTFDETAGWELRANGFAGAGTNGAYAQAQQAIFEGIDVRGDNNLFFCLTLTDPDLDGPAGPLFNIRADNNILTHSYVNDPAQQVLVRIQRDSDFNTVQNNVIECQQSSGTRRIAITLIVDNASGDGRFNAVTGNEIFNCADAVQTLEQASDPNNATDYQLGLVVENNDLYVLPEMYINCSTGAFDPTGQCACAENAIDTKIANQDGVDPYELGATQWATATATALGDIVRPTTYNGWAYYAETAGTTGGGEPTWPTTWRATVNDNGVTWVAIKGRHEYRANAMWGFRPIPAAANANCPNLSTSVSEAVSIHFTHADFLYFGENLIWDAQNAFWFSAGGADNVSLVNNILWDIDDKGCDGETSCANPGVMAVGNGERTEIYGNLVVESDDDWLDTTQGGTDAALLDSIGNLVIFSGDGTGALGANSVNDSNAWLGTTNTTAIGTNELLDDTVATFFQSTVYTAGDLLISGTGSGAIYEVQGNCTSDNSDPVWTADLDSDVVSNDCTFRVIRAPLVFKAQRWTNAVNKTIPYAIGGSASSPLSALPGDVDQGCQADRGVGNLQPTGVTC